MKRATQDTLLGLVFFTGLGLLLYATYSLTDLSLEVRPTLTVHAANVGGIRSGDPVFVLGNRIGQVRSIAFLADATDPDERMRLVLELREALPLKADVEVEITTASLLGGRVIEIDPGVAPEPWPGGILHARLKPNGLDAVGELLDDPTLKADFKGTISGIRRVVDQLNTTDGTLGRLINATDLHDEFTAAVKSARKSLEELEQAKSPLGRLIYSEVDGDKLSSALDSIDSIAKKIDEGTGLAGRIVNDSELADSAKRAIDDFAAFAAKINDPNAGLVGALVADAALREKGARIISDVEAITTELRTGNGVLARLINDEAMAAQLSRILNQVSRAIEDAREVAPIGTFFQVFSGAF